MLRFYIIKILILYCSSTQCDKYLQLFFTILEKSSLASIRANLIIAASDLVCRFPSTIEPWTPFMYDRYGIIIFKNTLRLFILHSG